MKHSSALHRRENLWTDSSSDDEEKKVKFEKFDSSNEESSPLSSSPCCLICSILPNLSNINTCSKHLQVLRRASVRSATQVVYMMHPPIRHCRCSRKSSKHRCRSMSSSSSESEHRHRRKKRSMTIQSSSSSVRFSRADNGLI